jgi:hypothetical protein
MSGLGYGAGALGAHAGLNADVHVNAHAGIGAGVGAGVGYGCGVGHHGYGMYTTAGIILVLYILLVIILRSWA